jgi:Uma2 family endonuclease
MSAEDLFVISSDDHKYELVAGTLVRMPPTGRAHGAVSVRVGRLLDEYVEAQRLGVVCGAETGFILRRRPDTVRAPDASFVRKERVPATGDPERYWPFAPDLAVEVLSPSERTADVQAKLADYFDAGTQLVWVIDLRERTVVVYRSMTEASTLREEDELIGGTVLPGFACPVRRFFE